MAEEDDLISRITIEAGGAQSGAAQAAAAFQQMQAAQEALAASTATASAAYEAFLASIGRGAVTAAAVSQRLSDGARSLVGLAPSVASGIRTINSAIDEQVASSAKADAALVGAVASLKALSAAQAGMAELGAGVGPLAAQLELMEAQRVVTQGYAKDVQRVAEMHAMEARAIGEARAAELARTEIRKEAAQVYASANADMVAAEARAAAARRSASDLMIPPIPANAKVWVTMGQDAEAAFSKGTAAASVMRREVEAVTTSGGGLSNWLRSVITLFDEFMRGQRGAEAATIGRVIKTGGGAGILAGVGAFAAIGGIEKITSEMAELAEKTDTAAAAAGMSVEQFSMFQRTMQLVDGNANTATRAIAMLGRQIETALADPMDKAAQEFSKFGITQTQLAAGLKDPLALLDLMRQRFQELPPDLQRTAIVSLSAGRGFQELIPYLKLTNDHVAELKSKLPISSIITRETVERLTPASESAHALGEAVTGLGLAIAQTTASTKFHDWLRDIVNDLTATVPKLDAFLKQTNNLRDLSRPGLAGGAVGTAVGGIAGFMVGGPVGSLAGAGLGAYSGYRTGTNLSGAFAGEGGASAAIPPSRFSVAPGADVTHSADQAALAQAMREAAEQLPAGYSVRATSGYRPGATVAGTGGTSQHALSEAIDSQITGPGGVVFPSMGADPTGIYKEYGDLVLKRLQVNAPELAGRFASGTQFTKADAGHYDLGGARGARGPLTASATIPPLPGGFDFETTVLNAPQPGATALEKEFQANLKFVEDKKKLIDADSANEVAAADKDETAIVAIKQRALKSTQAVLAQEESLRATYAARILQTEDVNAKEVAAKVQDSTNMKVKEVAAGTQAIEAQNTLARQHIQDEIYGLEAEKLKAKTFQEQYDIELKIADLKAKLNRDAAGELDKARALNALEKERLDQEIRNANFAERSSELAYQGLQLRGRIATQRGGGRGSEAGYSSAAAELSFVQRAGEMEISRYQEIADSAEATEKVREEMYQKIGEAALKTSNLELALAQRVDAQMKRSADESSKVFVQAFDSVGSSLEGAITNALSTGDIRGSVQKAGIGLVGDLIKGVAGYGSERLASVLGPAIGVAVSPGQGLGNVLGRGLGNLLGFGSSAAGSAVQNTATDLASQNMKVLSDQAAKLGVSFVTTQSANVANSAATLINTTATSANTAADAANTASKGTEEAVGGVGAAAGGAGGIASFFKFLGFSQGGIVPSAAGGFLVPGSALAGGGTLSILHPHEMVLPRPISEGIQNAIGVGGRGGGGNTANLTYAPTINAGTGGAFATRAQAEAMFRQHGDVMMGQVRNMIRNGWRP